MIFFLPGKINTNHIGIRRQEYKLPLASNVLRVSDKAVRTNPVLNKLRIIISNPKTLNTLSILKRVVNSEKTKMMDGVTIIDEVREFSDTKLKKIEEQLDACLSALGKENVKKESVIELLDSQEGHEVINSIRKLAVCINPVDTHFDNVSDSNVNKNAEQLVSVILSHIDKAKSCCHEIYSIEINNVLTGLKMLQILLFGNVLKQNKLQGLFTYLQSCKS